MILQVAFCFWPSIIFLSHFCLSRVNALKENTKVVGGGSAPLVP